MIKYPNGKKYSGTELREPSVPSSVDYSNRGMDFEEAIDASNQYYLEHNIAAIHKKPTPIQIVKVDYPQRSAAVIKEAYYKSASTTDYNGVFRGKYIDFEAKETKQVSFPLQNLHDHQVDHMRQVVHHKGISFILIHYARYDEIYLLFAEDLFFFWDRMKNGGRKSITRNEIAEKAQTIKLGFLPRIDYISIIQSKFLDDRR